MFYYPSFIPNLYKRYDLPIEGLVSALCDAAPNEHNKVINYILNFSSLPCYRSKGYLIIYKLTNYCSLLYGSDVG